MKQVWSSNYDEGKSWSEIITDSETILDGRLLMARLHGQAALRWKGFDITTMGGDTLLIYKG